MEAWTEMIKIINNKRKLQTYSLFKLPLYKNLLIEPNKTDFGFWI